MTDRLGDFAAVFLGLVDDLWHSFSLSPASNWAFPFRFSSTLDWQIENYCYADPFPPELHLQLMAIELFPVQMTTEATPVTVETAKFAVSTVTVLASVVQ